MALVYSSIRWQGPSATTATAVLPTTGIDVLVGQMVYIFVGNDVGTSAITITAGWSELSTQNASGGVRGAVFYRVWDGTETAPTITGSSGVWHGYTIVMKGYNSHSIVRGDWNNVQSYQAPAISSSGNNAIALYFFLGDATGYFTIPTEEICFIGRAGAVEMSNITTMIGSRNIPVAGAAPRPTMDHTVATEGGNVFVVVVEDDGNAELGPCISTTTPMCKTLASFFSTVAYTWTTPITKLTTVNGITVIDTVQTVAVASGTSDDWGRMSGWSTLNVNGGWGGGTVTLPNGPHNITDHIVALSYSTSASNTSASIGNEGIIIVMHDSSNNWAAYQATDKNNILGLAVREIYFAPGYTTPYASSGTINWADITHMTALMHRAGTTAVTLLLKLLVAYKKTMCMVGGTSEFPLTPAVFQKQLNQAGTSRRAVLAGSSLVELHTSLQFGDGTNKTYSDLATAMENPLSYSLLRRRIEWNVPSGRTFIRFYTSANDTVRLDSTTQAGNVPIVWEFDTSSSTSATVVTDGGVIKNATVNLLNGETFSNQTYTNCLINIGTAILKGAKISGGSGTNAATVTTGTKIDGCTFTKGTDTYALTVSGTGDLYLTDTPSLGYTTFSGYTTDLNLLATTGTLTIHLALLQPIPTYTSAGVTVVIDQPNANPVASISGFSSNSHLIVHNVTENTILLDAKVVGTSWSDIYVEGTDYNVGDVIDVYHVWMAADSTSATKKTKTRTVASASGWSALIQEETCAIYGSYYTTYSVTGATVAGTGEIVRDGANLQIDLDDPDDQWYAYRMFVWDKYDIWNTTGNRVWFLNLTANDTGNIDLGTGSTLDNLNVNTVKQIDAVNITADNGSTISPVQNPTTGGGGITMFSGGKVLVTSTGSMAPSESQIKTWIRDELTTELARIDVNVSSRLATTSYTAPDNASITTISSKLPSLGAKIAGEGTTIQNLDQLPTELEIAASVRTELATELASITDMDTNGVLLTSTAVNAIWNKVLYGTKTAVQVFFTMASVLWGKASGLDTTTVIFRDPSDTKDVITSTVDSSGNRSSVTVDDA